MTSRSFVRVGSAAALTLALAIPAGGAIAQDGASITFLTPPWGVPPDQEALEAFEAESGITVEVIDAGQMETLFTNVSVAAAAGEPAADVIFLTEEAPSNIVATGNVEDISDLVAAAGTDLGEFAQVDFWQDGDALYGIPVYSQLVMMDFNAKKLADAGLEPPTTWAELSEQAYAMQEAGADPNPVAFGAIDWSWYLMALSMGDQMFDDELNPVFADEGSKAREAMAMLLGWFEDEIISPGIIGIKQRDPLRGSMTNARVARKAHTVIILQGEVTHLAIARYELTGGIARAVVHHDNLCRGIALRDNGIQGPLQGMGTIECRNDDADLHDVSLMHMRHASVLVITALPGHEAHGIAGNRQRCAC